METIKAKYASTQSELNTALDGSVKRIMKKSNPFP